MTENNNDKPASSLVIQAQYLKDLSFENPNAPLSLRPDGGAPEMDIKVGIDARKLPDAGDIKDMHEVSLSIKAQANRKNGDVMFIAELQYCIAVSIDESAIPEGQIHPLLFIEVPRMAFPFARQVIADTTLRGGFPPLLLQPVDFHALYVDRFAKEMEENKRESENATN